MKTSVNWLAQYIDFNWDAQELAHRLTMAGLEVEDIDVVGELPDSVVVGEVRKRDKHPNADRLSVCEVEAGEGELLQIVCGAPNCDAGKKFPLATIGTDFGGGFKVKKTKLRGVESQGMLCSENELGISDEQSGLMELPDDAVPGRPVKEFVEQDTVIDWEITPNRPDWLSHIGIAREIAAVADKAGQFSIPEINLAEKETKSLKDADVEVQDPELCPRYTARVIDGVKIGPSPEWMQRALSKVGIRPINNVVDITNYVLMECGQPLHAFDYDKIAGHKIIVRCAADGECMTTLDGENRELTAGNLVIADTEKAIALAGVMGGQSSEISEETTTVLLESAAFSAPNVRSTAKQLGVSTESSYRFERGVDIDMVQYASDRAAELLCDLAGGDIAGDMIDVYNKPYEPRHVSCRVAKCCELLGIDIDETQISEIFKRLGLDVVEESVDQVVAAVPAFRQDLTREADLIEEVARVYGLENIAAAPVRARAVSSFADDQYAPLQQVRREMLGLGLTESMTYSLLGSEQATAHTGVTKEELISLANPISAENDCMRPSLLPSLITTVENNIAHGNHDLAMFEVGRVLRCSPNMPEERYQLGIILTGRKFPDRYGDEKKQVYDFFDLKGLLDGWLEHRRIQRVKWEPAETEAFAAGHAARVLQDDEVLAVCGQVGSGLTGKMRLRSPLFMAVVELDKVNAAVQKAMQFEELPQYPATQRDISLVAPPAVSHRDIVEVVESLNNKWLADISLFDVYEDKETLGAGRRSLAYTLTYRDDSRTLKDEEVNKAHEKVRRQLENKLAVELR